LERNDDSGEERKMKKWWGRSKRSSYLRKEARPTTYFGVNGPSPTYIGMQLNESRRVEY
jgi:hypothetical protein